MQITHYEVVLLPIDQLERHPHNRPLGLTREKVDQLKESIRQYGFYDSQPLTVRKLSENGHYQIVKGEHRWIAAKELDMTEIPCSIQQMTDEEALIQLIVGNIQTESHPLEIGLNALRVVQKDSKKGLSAAAYGEKVGIGRKVIGDYLRAAKIYDYLKQQCNSGVTLLQDVSKLIEISKLPKTDWLWLHDFILEHECSKQQVITIVKAIKSFRDAVKDKSWYDLLLHNVDVITLAKEALNETNRELKQLLTFLTRLQENLDKFDDTAIYYEFSEEQEEILETEHDLKAAFLDWLAKEEKRTVNAINQIYKKLREEIRAHTYEKAKEAMEFYQDEEMERIRQETREAILEGWIEGLSVEEIAKDVWKTPEEISQILEELFQEHDIQNITIYPNDLFDTIDQIPDQSINLLNTDPPYFVLANEGVDWDSFPSFEAFLTFTEDWLHVVIPKIKPNGRAYISFSPDYHYEFYEILKRNAFFGMELAGTIIWHKPNNNQPFDRKRHRLNYEPIFYLRGQEAEDLNFPPESFGEMQGCVWNIATPQSNFHEGKTHPAQKPKELYYRILLMGCQENEVVLDCFAGSGTTGVIAKELNRKAILIEKSPEDVKILKRRLIEC